MHFFKMLHELRLFFICAGIQVDIKPKAKDASVQCDLQIMTYTPVRRPIQPLDIEMNMPEDLHSALEDSWTASVDEPSVDEPSVADANLTPNVETALSPSSVDKSVHIKETCYLVFESALMLLLSICKFCHTSANTITRKTIGSFLEVTMFCQHCCKTWRWSSQPFIGNITAGNILTSAAILYSGSLPAKALRLFDILNCPTITNKTFFRHQNFYLQPAVDLVWEYQREALLEQLKCENGLTFGGDGRVDSPGHSAKYGSYTLLELSCHKVVDFQLVQVSYYD